MTAPRFLFVPVSGPTGMGEYARCLTLAGAVRSRWPEAAIHFLLSEQAPYARSTPYEYTLFPGSPTLHDVPGREAIRRFAPDVALFDNAGRKGQLATAAGLGARVIYVSSRWRPRMKAFRFRWMRHLDEHWIPYPEFAGGRLTRWEAFKLRLLGRPRVRCLDVMLPLVAAEEAAAVLARRGLAHEGYVLVVPGGGTGHPGVQLDAYETAAQRLAAVGARVVVVGREAPPIASGEAATGAARSGDSPATRDAPGEITWTGRVPPAELAALLPHAAFVVTNGGDTLLQSLACGRATVAAPIAGDQPERLARCAARGGVAPVALDGDALADAAVRLHTQPADRARLASAAVALGLVNGVQIALDAFEAMVRQRAGATGRGSRDP